jgi:hypothetical protein
MRCRCQDDVNRGVMSLLSHASDALLRGYSSWRDVAVEATLNVTSLPNLAEDDISEAMLAMT